MRIASIGMQVKGGAGLSSLKLHREFLKQGNDARFYVAKQTIHEDEVRLIRNKIKYRDNWWNLGTLPVIPKTEHIVSSGLCGKSREHLEYVYKWADVILLRWVTATVSDWQIGCWSRRKKPVVWCLSDMAPITGGCHYSGGCSRYESDCANCPVVTNGFEHVPSLILKRRKVIWDRLTVVSPSRWLFDCCRNSAVLGDKDIRLIRTGVELDVFRPFEKLAARQQFGMDHDKIVVFFGAYTTNEERKGLKILLEMLKILVARGYGPDRLAVLATGAGVFRAPGLPLTCIHLGAIDSRDDMARVYSAADLTVLPYKEDNLPNVMLESIACGTPVCAFDVGGMPDVIEVGVNGTLAVPFDPWDLANSAISLIERPLSPSQIRSWAERNLSLDVQAKQYLDLFQELLTEH